METLIELYDERPVENVLASEVFRPKRTIFLCPGEVAQNKRIQEKVRGFFAHRHIDAQLVFLETSIYNTEKIKRQLRHVSETYPDCVLDITGGTDAGLFAGGLLCAETDMPVFTYSRRRNRFYNIHNAPFAEDMKCRVQYNVEDCFLMAGGALRRGRVDNSILLKYMGKFDSFFELYLSFKSEWTKLVGYIQAVSQTDKGAKIPMRVEGSYYVKGERGSVIAAPEAALRALEELGFIRSLSIERGKTTAFEFYDAQVRMWLRDIGSVLELYVYKACVDTGIFNDVRTSAVVDWEGDFRHDSVTNEIDVMAMQGIIPAFISCKTCAVNTEALNELSVLRDRFGGMTAKAAIVTTQHCRSITRHRASELNIKVIELSDLRQGQLGNLLRTLMRTE